MITCSNTYYLHPSKIYVLGLQKVQVSRFLGENYYYCRFFDDFHTEGRLKIRVSPLVIQELHMLPAFVTYICSSVCSGL